MFVNQNLLYIKIKNYLHKLHNLEKINYNKTTIFYNSIDAFLPASKKLNDKNNKIRENIIGAIVNKKIPDSYLISNRWNNLITNVNLYISSLIDYKINDIKLINLGGRKYNYDYKIIVNNINEYNIELKFNSRRIVDTPQFVSPMFPSQYMDNSYEEFYYNNYLKDICNIINLPIPDKNIYLKQIHSNNPVCVKDLQTKYYNGCKSSSKFTNNKDDINFYNICKQKDRESRKLFIKNNNLNIEKLNDYLYKSQQNKIYMFYYNGKFYKEYPNMEDYKITSVISNKYSYICTTLSNKKMKILLRWKNGNGIAFPAFQIS